jgi:NAD(P)-dependent dehydrogenase (short-subunit alcohol dehydrogenase family)
MKSRSPSSTGIRPNPRTGKLRGRVALVTGSSRRVGKGIALTLGETGATVYITGRTTRGKLGSNGVPGTIHETAREVTARGGIGIPVRMDHARDQELKRLIERIRQQEGGPDLLVNNAFGGEDGSRPIMTYDGFPFWKHNFDEWWHRMFTAYLRSDFATTYHALPLMIRRHGGLIVNTLWWNRGRYLCDLFFDVASSAVGRMAYGLDLELRTKGVAVVGLSPGWTRTEHVSHLPERVLKQLPAPEYVGRAVVHLALDPRIREKSGKVFEVGALAKEYGFTNADGRVIDYHAEIRKHPIPGWPPD